MSVPTAAERLCLAAFGAVVTFAWCVDVFLSGIVVDFAPFPLANPPFLALPLIAGPYFGTLFARKIVPSLQRVSIAEVFRAAMTGAGWGWLIAVVCTAGGLLPHRVWALSVMIWLIGPFVGIALMRVNRIPSRLTPLGRVVMFLVAIPIGLLLISAGAGLAIYAGAWGAVEMGVAAFLGPWLGYAAGKAAAYRWFSSPQTWSARFGDEHQRSRALQIAIAVAMPVYGAALITLYHQRHEASRLTLMVLDAGRDGGFQLVPLAILLTVVGLRQVRSNSLRWIAIVVALGTIPVWIYSGGLVGGLATARQALSIDRPSSTNPRR